MSHHLNVSPQRDPRPGETRGSWLFSRTGLFTIAALAIIAFLIYTGHGAHLLGAIPYLFLLACPFLHILGHGGHRHGDPAPTSQTGAQAKRQGGGHH